MAKYRKKMERKFIYFTDSELNILADAIEEYRCPDLMKQINEEIRTREYNKKTARRMDEESTENILLLDN